MLLLDLLKNDNLVKALYFDSPDFLDKNISPDFDRASLLYDRVWPFRFIPDIQDERKSIVMTKWRFLPYKGDDFYKVVAVTFFVIVHFDLMRTDEGLRTDFIFYEIDKVRRNSSILGTSKFKLAEPIDDFAADSGAKWLGASFGYRALKLDVAK